MKKKGDYLHNSAKSAIAQGTGTAISRAFGVIMTSIGHPEAIMLSPLVRGAFIGVMNTCYDDIKGRLLSKIENKKVDDVMKIALETFYEFADKDCVTAVSLQMDEGQIEYAFEASEDLMLTAIRQSEHTKVEILGRYYGQEFYKGTSNWQDMHQMITMSGTLTLRQLVLIRLISEGFKGLDNSLYITNSSACVEINHLRNYGIWKTDGAMLGIDESRPLQLSLLQPTEYASIVCDSLMLKRLSDNDINRTLDTLQLSRDGSKAELITADEYHMFAQVLGDDDLIPAPVPSRAIGEDRLR